MTEKEKEMTHEMPEHLPELPKGWVFLGQIKEPMFSRCPKPKHYKWLGPLGWNDSLDERTVKASNGKWTPHNRYAVPIDSEAARQALGLAPEPESPKPSWADAPDWAEWLAQDRGGCWWLYSEKPNCDVWRDVWQKTFGSTKHVGSGEPNPNWRTTLERRPESELAGIQRGMDEALERVGQWAEMRWPIGGGRKAPDLIIPADITSNLTNLAAISRKAGYRIEWDSNGIRGWKE